MAAPSIGNQIGTNGTTATTTPAVTLPSGITSGQLLVVLFRSAVAGAVGWPSDWVELKDESPDGDDDQVAVAYKFSDGTEGGSITLSSGNGKFAAAAWRITGMAGPSRVPEITTAATGASTTPDPGASTPTGGTKDYLFLALGTQGGENTFTSHPTNYTLGQVNANSGSGGATTTNARVFGSGRQVTGSTEDPGNFTTSSVAEDWTCYTMAIHPPSSVELSAGELHHRLDIVPQLNEVVGY